MVQKPRAVKYKVITGYLLLFSFAALSVWFLYTEILKAALPGNSHSDDKKIILISKTVADLYASEAMGRTSILTGSPEDHQKYNHFLDSIDRNLDIIKEDAEPGQLPKFDSIQMLLQRKRQSTADLIEYRRNSSNENTFNRAVAGIYNVRDSIYRKVKPVKINKQYKWSELVNSLLTPKQLDSLSKLDVSNDSLAMAFDKVLNNVLIKSNRLEYNLYLKERDLLEENRIITDQISTVLSSVENEILQNSYREMAKSQLSIGETINTISWMGAIGLLLLVVFATVILSDLTSNQNYRKRLEVLNLENEELLRSKSMLMATVTHDLQTPLGSIIGFSDLMDSSGITGKQQHYIKNIKESADYILKLVNDLLDFSKLENNRISIEEVSFNFQALIDNTCQALEPAAESKGIELSWEIEEELNGNFVSDPYRLKQVLTNLVSNSIKFTQEGSVEVTAGIRNGRIIICVIDTGIGIAKAKQEDVFKEFTQAHSGIEKKFGGTGLGLTISRKMIELLGGSITLESQEGKGSIFTIELPCKPGKKSLLNIAPEPIAHDNYSILNGKKMLIIDDDTTQLALLKEIFTGYQAQVITEPNSSLVRSILERECFEIILSDIQMPGMDGFEIINMIRQHPNSTISEIPVIALSGKKDLSEADFIDRGFTAHHPKPINLQLLLGAISFAFGQKLQEFENPKERLQPSTSLFNLKSLSQFTHNDPESLKMIIDTFVASASDNCNALKAAAKEKNEQKLSDVAHRMIPMLRQMDVYSIVKLLDPLEDKALLGEWAQIENHVDAVCSQMAILTSKLIAEVN